MPCSWSWREGVPSRNNSVLVFTLLLVEHHLCMASPKSTNRHPLQNNRFICAFPILPAFKTSSLDLSPIAGNTDSYVNNLSKFVSFIQMQKLAQKDILVSFDVVSLFTCVLVELAVDIAQHRPSSCDENLPDRTSLSVQKLLGSLVSVWVPPIISWRTLPADLRHGDGISSLCDSGQLGNRRCGG